MACLKIRSAEGQIFDVNTDIVKWSPIIKNLVDALNTNNPEERIISLPQASASLKMIIEWTTHHKDDDPLALEDDENAERRTDNIPLWDINFLKVDHSTMFLLVKAAHELRIKALVQMICKTIANMMKNKSPRQIRNLFNIKNDFTPEEQRRLRRENRWRRK